MPSSVPSPKNLLATLREAYPEYDDRAYGFVLAAIEYAIENLDERRHIEAEELAEGVRALAQEKFGVLAREVLGHWGIRTTDDIGTVVYALVDAGMMHTREGDSVEQFDDLYDFEEVFDETYEIGRELREPSSRSR